jgi:DNA repair ATPase RecN
MLSLNERKEAVEERLDWIDQQKSILYNNYTRSCMQLERLREQALSEMRDIIREEMKGRSV